MLPDLPPSEYLQYRPEWFVDRKREIERVMPKARDMAAGQLLSRSDRVVHFPGYSGSGKTWLLRHLRHLITEDEEQKIPNAIVFHARLSYDYKQRYPCEPPFETITRKLLEDLLQHISQIRSGGSRLVIDEEATLQDMCRLLQKTVHDLLGTKIVILLIDELDDVPPGWLNVLEDRLFALLLSETHVLLVLGGRTLGHDWRTFELVPADEPSLRLQPLGQGDTCEQIKRQVPGAEILADKIFALTGGVPRGNFIGASLASQSPQIIDETQAITLINSELLKEIPGELLQYMKAVCVLRGLDDERMAIMLDKYVSPTTSWDVPMCRDLLARLTPKWARWDKTSREYKVDEYARIRLEIELQKCNADLWRRMHCTAYRMYSKWITDFPNARDRWQPEANYHAERLRASGYDPYQSLRPPTQVVICMERDLQGLTIDERENLIVALSCVLDTCPAQIRILQVTPGSVQITLEMPEDVALRLVSKFKAGDSEIRELRIVEVKLGISVTPSPSVKPFSRQIDPAKLRQVLTERFNESELRNLCFDLHVDYESLTGAGKEDKARELVAYLERRGRLSELVETGKRQRPDIDWVTTQARRS